jgi:hypothetical protein
MGRYLGRRAKMTIDQIKRIIATPNGTQCPKDIACDGCPANGECGTSYDHTRRIEILREWLASHPEASKPVERFEVGKWYLHDGNHKGAGRFIGISSRGCPGFYYPSWDSGHDGNGETGIPREPGNHCWYEMGNFTAREVPAPTEPAKDSPRRLTVGDRVVITGGHTAQSDWTGKHGIIAEDDHSVVRPYRIKIDGGDENGIEWRMESEVIPEPPGYTAEAPKTTDPSAEKILAEYYGPLHVQVIKYASGDVRVITPRVGRLTRAQERQRAREARLSRI